MRLIDPEDAIRGIVIESVSDNDEAIKATAKAIVVIQNTPTIVEFEGDINKVIVKGEEYHRIVRCKDCKYMTEHYDTDGNAPYWTCSEWDSGTDYDGFCHLAERRNDGTD